jgi:hypothetical protein
MQEAEDESASNLEEVDAGEWMAALSIALNAHACPTSTKLN